MRSFAGFTCIYTAGCEEGKRCAPTGLHRLRFSCSCGSFQLRVWVKRLSTQCAALRCAPQLLSMYGIYLPGQYLLALPLLPEPPR
jgi:hypothetical protein